MLWYDQLVVYWWEVVHYWELENIGHYTSSPLQIFPRAHLLQILHCTIRTKGLKHVKHQFIYILPFISFVTVSESYSQVIEASTVLMRLKKHTRYLFIVFYRSATLFICIFIVYAVNEINDSCFTMKGKLASMETFINTTCKQYVTSPVFRN